ncbi:MAG: cytochrome c3 family protein [bacterium]
MRIQFVVLLGVLAMVTGCEKEEAKDSLFPHGAHTATDVPASCTLCHAVTADAVSSPAMNRCLSCHSASKDDPWFASCAECHEMGPDFVLKASNATLKHREVCGVGLPPEYADVFFDHGSLLSLADSSFGDKDDYESPFPHRPHQELEVGCNTCHASDDSTLSYPTVQSCLECHEIDASDSMTQKCSQCHTVDKAFGELDQPIHHRVSLDAERPRVYERVQFDHVSVLKDEESCVKCHDGQPETEPYVEVHLPTMEESTAFYRSMKKDVGCLDCHTKSEAPSINETCLSCHKAGGDAVGLANMDSSIEAVERLGLEPECSLCHRELDRDVQPPSHKRGDWHRSHGFAEDLIDVGRCALCHEDNTCQMCHAVEQPRSHTNVWRNRVHGLQAAYERDRCLVCHRADSCDRCHREVSPRNHVGGWGAPQNRHCLRCHAEPGEPVGCYACHRTDRVQSVHQMESQASFSDPSIAAVHRQGISCLLCHETLVPRHGLVFEDFCTECHRF